MSRPCLALLLALTAALCAAAPADAGTYQVYSCRTPANAVAPSDGWEAIAGHDENVKANCSAASPNLSVRTVDHRDLTGTYFGLHYGAAADTTFSKLTLWRYAEVSHVDDDAARAWTAWLSLGAPASASSFEKCGLSCLSKGTDAEYVLDGNRVPSPVIGQVRDAYVVVGCEGQAGAGCNVNHPSGFPSQGYARLSVQAAQAEFTDSMAPTAGAPTGTLLATGAHRGTQTLEFTAADRGAGLYHSTIEVKQGTGTWARVQRQVVDGNEGRCAELDYLADTDREFGYRVPCALAATEQMSFDTTQLADGVYQVRALLEDAAGNEVTVLPERALEVDNVPPPSVTTPPAIAGSPKLDATLQASPGGWTGTGNQYSYLWQQCKTQAAESCASITSADTATYHPVVEDLGRYLRVSVTASNSQGTTVTLSDGVGPVTDASSAVPQCADGEDNDGDGKVDTDDAQCKTRAGTSEAPAPAGTSTATPTPTVGGATGGGSGAGASGGGSSGGGGAATTANGVNASTKARLGISGPASRTIGFRRSGQTRVTLRDENGRAISGATIQVLQRMTVPGQPFVPAHSPVTTDADGSVRYLIEPGYSRTLRFAYAPTLGGQATIVRDLKLTVRSRTTLRTDKSFLRNGQTVRFLGRVLSTPVPSAGVVIDLQARVGRRWQTFNSIRSNSAGKWHASYHFRSTRGLQTYTFRARVRGDTGFPYAPSRSKPVKVRVKG